MTRIEHGDCRDVLRRLADEGVFVDSVVSDPPYHLTSIVKRFADAKEDREQYAKKSHSGYMSRGFMGKKWDGGDIAFNPELWRLVSAVMKPGAHLCAFGGTRTYHRLACAIEDAGFEIRDAIMWHYASGFPKSHDVSKAIDRSAGAERERVREPNPRNPKATGGGRDGMDGATRPWIEAAMARGYHEKDGPIPATAAAAAAWQGWGTALKPATEIICLARKPLSEKTVAANVLKHGTGAMNIDACRIPTSDNLGGGGEKAETSCQFTNEGWRRPWMDDRKAKEDFAARVRANVAKAEVLGRWPANMVHDGSEEVLQGFPESAGQQGDIQGTEPSEPLGKTVYGDGMMRVPVAARNDSGSAARFFFSAKADAEDRIESRHPTVKPVSLIRWLARLITPPRGTILDPFAGTGTTAVAAIRESMRSIVIEREDEYIADIRRRIAMLSGADTPLFAGTPDRQLKLGEGAS